ncbi:MAG: peptidoglycan bridge formation glycyltransferase FemA/FemB family protein [Anaerolineales bacterium]|nr:MAG: peptidoglycan bridge formation glycyltransferase FemA/FemB family protein [Anaerolineales bacterium]
MSIRIRLSTDKEHFDSEAWNSFVAASLTGHLLQSWQWGQLKAAFGWQAVCVGVEDGGCLVAGAQVLFRSLLSSFPCLSIAYVPKGPIFDFGNQEISEALFSAIHRLARQKGAILLKIEPEMSHSPALVRQLQACGFRPSQQTIQPRSTLHVDLQADPDEILARMKSKTRYNVRLAERKGVLVQGGTADDLPSFYRLIELTGRRDGFAVHSQEYYETAYRLFVPLGLARLFLATYGDRVIAGLMVFAFGQRAWYMYGASSDRERNRMPNHLLQWEAIRWAREQGCLTYDLWGIPDEVGKEPEKYERTVTDRQGGLWGVYRFKQGFGGQVVRYVGAYDYVYRPALAWLYNKVVAWR